MSVKTPIATPRASKPTTEPLAVPQDSISLDLSELRIATPSPVVPHDDPPFSVGPIPGQSATLSMGDIRIKAVASASSRIGDPSVQMQQSMARLQTTVDMIFRHFVLREMDQAAEKNAGVSHQPPTRLLTEPTRVDSVTPPLPHSTTHEGPSGREHSLPDTPFGRIAMWKRVMRWVFVTSTEGGWAVAGYIFAALFAALMFSFKEKPSPFWWLLSLPALGAWLMVIWKGPILRHRNDAHLGKS